MSEKLRLDVAVFERGFAETREKAKALIMAGSVYLNGQKALKGGVTIKESDVIEVRGAVNPYVSRGGLKLHKAVGAFGLNLKDCICMDIGASTGGFTDCLLRRGAREVYSIDAGVDQLHESLRNDARVHSIEKFNARELTAEITNGENDVAVMDVSFISQTYIIPQVAGVLCDGGSFVSLIKPQFEAGRSALSKGGVVTNSAYRFLAVKRVINCALENGFDCVGLIRSPIEGGDGNVEYLAHFVKKACVKPKVDDKLIKRITSI